MNGFTRVTVSVEGASIARWAEQLRAGDWRFGSLVLTGPPIVVTSVKSSIELMLVDDGGAFADLTPAALGRIAWDEALEQLGDAFTEAEGFRLEIEVGG